MFSKRATTAVAILVLLLGACSSGESSSDQNNDSNDAAQETETPESTPTEDTGPTSEEFIAEAEQVCVASAEQIENLYKQAGIPENEKQDFALGADLISAREERIDNLNAVEPSEELADQWDEYLAARTESLELIQKRYDLLKAGNTKKAKPLQDQINKKDEEWQALGEDIGFEACAARLSAPEENKVTKAITQFFEGDPQKTCSTVVYKTYLDFLGGQEGCAQAVQQGSGIKIDKLDGVDKVGASAEVTGSAYGKPATVEVTYDGGKYQIRSFYFL